MIEHQEKTWNSTRIYSALKTWQLIQISSIFPARCCSFTQQAAKHPTAVHSLPPTMGGADALVLANHMAFAKCVFQCLKMPPPITLSVLVVFNSPLYHLISPEAGTWQGMWLPNQWQILWPGSLWGCFENKSTVDSILSEVSCHHKTCFSRHKTVLGSSMWHRMCFQPTGDCLHNFKDLVLALMGSWVWDPTGLPGLPIFIFWPSFATPQRP